MLPVPIDANDHEINEVENSWNLPSVSYLMPVPYFCRSCEPAGWHHGMAGCRAIRMRKGIILYTEIIERVISFWTENEINSVNITYDASDVFKC